MNINEVRQAIREVIAEAMKEKNSTPIKEKSSGKLMDLKKELKSLENMREALGQYQITEGDESTPGFVAEYAHMQKFVNEFNKIKEAHARLAEMLDNQISEVKNKVVAETQKIKEMIGLAQPQDEAKKKKPAKEKKEEEKEEVKEARFKKGEDVGKPGKGFAKIAKSAAKQYGSKEAGQKVAGAILKKVVAKK